MFYRLWNEEIKDAQRKNRRPRLRKAFIKFLGLEYLMRGLLPLIEVRVTLIVETYCELNYTLKQKFRSLSSVPFDSPIACTFYSYISGSSCSKDG